VNLIGEGKSLTILNENPREVKRVSLGTPDRQRIEIELIKGGTARAGRFSAGD
jgi:hypothetical protein